MTTEETGKILGAYNLYTSLATTLSPIIFGYLATLYNAKTNPMVYGRLLIAFVLSGYLPAAFFYRIAGKKYVAQQEEQQAEEQRHQAQAVTA